MLARLSIPLALILIGSFGCDEPQPETKKPPGEAPAKTVAPANKPKEMPSITVDDQGPFIAGERMKLDQAGGTEKLTKVVSGLPIDGTTQLELITLRKAKTPDVAAVIDELAKAGAPTIKIKTDGRDDLPKEIIVTPLSKVMSPPKCSLVVKVLEDLSTAVWPLDGSTHGKKHSKGFAGPDLSHTQETLEKDIPKCKSSVAFFSADDSVSWEMAHNLAGTLLKSDLEKQLQTIVFLTKPPVAGRAVDGI